MQQFNSIWPAQFPLFSFKCFSLFYMLKWASRPWLCQCDFYFQTIWECKWAVNVDVDFKIILKHSPLSVHHILILPFCMVKQNSTFLRHQPGTFLYASLNNMLWWPWVISQNSFDLFMFPFQVLPAGLTQHTLLRDWLHLSLIYINRAYGQSLHPYFTCTLNSHHTTDYWPT